MRRLRELLRWELVLQRRSYLYPATAVSTGLICAFVLLLPGGPLSPRLAAFFVFLDPATIGLAFVGAMVLTEKGRGTLDALAVTPLRTAEYVGAKTLSLTLVALASGLIVAHVATGGGHDLSRQLPALALSSSVAVLLGLASVAKARSMNHLVVILLAVSTVLYLPLPGHFGALPTAVRWIFAVVPSHAMLVLLTDAAMPGAASPPARVVASLYLGAWIGVGWWWTVRGFERAVVTEGR